VSAKPARKSSPVESRPKPAPPELLLPMQLQIGDRLANETGEGVVIGRPYTTARGKIAHVGVRRVGRPDVTDIRM
jgi:hypothetical protein